MHTKSYYSMLLLGIGAGMSFFVFVAVQIRLAQIDMADPSTWPNMGPQMAYFGIPMFTAFVAVPSVLINLCLDLAKQGRVSGPRLWFVLGAAYSLLGTSYPMAVAGMNGVVSLLIGATVAIVAALFVRRHWGQHFLCSVGNLATDVPRAVRCRNAALPGVLVSVAADDPSRSGCNTTFDSSRQEPS